MAENPDLAAGFSKQGKDRQEALWKETAADLNSAGPPTKTVSEWKRVIFILALASKILK